jgi:hypothetical protein
MATSAARLAEVTALEDANIPGVIHVVVRGKAGADVEFGNSLRASPALMSVCWGVCRAEMPRDLQLFKSIPSFGQALLR